MPKIEEEISTAAKKTFNKLKKTYGDGFVMENLLSEYKNFETAEAENEVLKKELEVLKKVAKKEAQVGTQTSSPSPAPDILAVLNNTIEVYARENDRLLKITNFSEYDEKINNLKVEIREHKTNSEKLSEALKSEKKRAVELEFDKSKLEEKIEELSSALEAEKTEVSEFVTKVTNLESDKAKLNQTVTAYAEELKRAKDEIETLKQQVIPVPDNEPEVTTYS